MKKVIAALLAAVLTASVASCGTPAATSSAGSADASAPSTASTEATAGGDIYYLNFKPEIAQVYDEIAKAYKAETGVTLKVVTAAAGTYEQTLQSEIAKADAPTIFQINGPKGYANWKNYTADMKDTELYQHLTDKSMAITDGEGVYGVPYVVEGYGIIYNNALMEKYFALPDRATTVKSMDEINNFATLKAVVEDMTAQKEKLEIKGVFAATSLKPGEDWRWQTHLANVPMHYEFQKNAVDLASNATDQVTFEYNDNYKNIFDLYVGNSTVDAKILGSKGVNDSMAEFALGEAAMVQNGNWAWGQIKDIENNTIKEEDIKFMPIYTGMEGEENQGLCTGTENFFAINSQVSPEKQKLSADFLYWLYSSKTGKDFVTNKLNFIAPFDTFTPEERPTDPLAKEINRWLDDSTKASVSWDFLVFPSQQFKDDFGADLLEYAQGKKEWTEVKTNFVANWMKEAELAAKANG